MAILLGLVAPIWERQCQNSARRVRMTKQAMGRLVREFQELGYIVLRSDPSDRRAKRGMYAELGQSLAEVAEHSTEEV